MTGYSMAMKKVTVAMTKEMYEDLEKERRRRRLSSVAETARAVLGEYLAKSQPERNK